MQWIERFGGYLALWLLAFMWPVIDVVQKGLLPSDYGAIFALSASAYVVVYSWYCLWGHTRRNAAVPVGTVLVLTLPGLALQHLVGMPNFNYLLIRLAGARHCQLSLAETDGHLQVEVLNDGWRVVPQPAGNGLRGLQERLAALGGTLEASPLPEAGFRLRATLRERLSSDSVQPAAEVVA